MDILNFFWKIRKTSEQVEHEQAAVNEVEKAEQPESQSAAAELTIGFCWVGDT
jgi:hypothetical protein